MALPSKTQSFGRSEVPEEQSARPSAQVGVHLLAVGEGFKKSAASKNGQSKSGFWATSATAAASRTSLQFCSSSIRVLSSSGR